LPRKIIFFSSAEEMAGTYFRAFFLAKYLVKEGHKVLLILRSKEPSLKIVRKLLDGVNVFLLPSLVTHETSSLVGSSSRVATVFMNTIQNCLLEIANDFDVIHSFDVMWPQNAAPLLVSNLERLLRIRHIKIYADWDDWWGRGGIISLYKGLYRLMAHPIGFMEEKFPRCADYVTVTTEILKYRALQSRIKPEKLFIIPNGANVEDIKPLDRNTSREELNLPLENKICTQIWSSSRDLQSFKLLLQAHKKVTKVFPEALLLFVGRMKVSKAQMNFIKSLDLSRNVMFTGWQPYHKYSLYLGASNVLLLPMQDTIFDRARSPLRLGDYLAAGRPIIATALPEVEKIVSHCGLVAAPNDAKDFGEKLSKILQNADLSEEMGKRARELAERKYSWQILAQKLEQIYAHN